MAANRSLLEQVVPQYDVNEVHSIMVHASPEDVYRAIRSISMSDLTIGRILFWLRRLPAMLIAPGRAVIGQQSSRQPFLEALSHAGFVQVAETPNEEIVIGLVGKFWQPVQNQVKLDDGEAFRRFDDPSYAKAVINFQIASVSEGDVRVTTETRVRVQDPAGRLLFRMYWALIGLFSGLIRIEMLRQIKRTAEGGYHVR